MTTSLLDHVVRILQDSQIPFALIGAAAMAAHGVSRSTYDTDFFSVGPAALDPVIWKALGTSGVRVDVRIGDDDDPLLGVVRFAQDDQAIDLVVGRSRWQQEVIARAKPTYVFKLNIPIVTVEDLILLKLYAGGIQDRWDIQQLVESTSLIAGHIDERVASLPERCQALWSQLRPTTTL